MELIRNINIRNFKSLENVVIQGCRRYNIFVGRPNVGKSNILEALSLFALPYIAGGKFNITQLLRMDYNASSLFYNGDLSSVIEIIAGKHRCAVSLQDGGKLLFNLNNTPYPVINLKVEASLDKYPVFKPYYYGQHLSSESVTMPFLCPIGGDNLMQVIKQYDSIRNDISKLLARYGLKLMLDTAAQQIRITKELDADTSFIIPYTAMASSLKRLIFYKAAIGSNKDSVLIMEEPEAHSYPPYIVKVIQSMLESDTNQYFLTTHSPYVINEFLENKADIAIFLVDYINGKTIIKTLTDKQLQQIYEEGVDLFFNTEFFAE